MKNKIILISIFTLAFLLRFWHLGTNPPSLDWDEASLGYNAYSILETGRDEYGSFLPLSIRSFNDYKPPLYTYLTTLPVYIFGLNEFSTRFTSALLGFLTVIVGYFLIKELFPNKSFLFFVLCSLFFAISPWHIQFSRIAFEANIALFFYILAVTFFLKAQRTGYLYIPSFISFVLALYAYHSPRLVIPALFVGMFYIFRQNITQNLKLFTAGFLLFVLLALPILKDLTSATGARFGSVTLLNAQEQLGESINQIKRDKEEGNLLGALTHNRRLVFAREILGGYLDHFNFDFLFLTGDPPGRHHAYGMGMLYIWELPFILMGIYFLLQRRDKNTFLLIWLFLVAPVASSLTKGTPHAVRSLLYLPTYQIFAAMGVFGFLLFLKNRLSGVSRTFVTALTFLIFIFNFYYYLHMYYIHTPVVYADSWQYGYKEALEEVAKYESSVHKVIFTYKYDQPYIYYLFYNKVDPTWYQENWGGGEVLRDKRSFGKYEFRNIDWGKDSTIKNIILVGTPKEIPADVNGRLSDIYFPDGSVAFRIVRL